MFNGKMCVVKLIPADLHDSTITMNPQIDSSVYLLDLGMMWMRDAEYMSGHADREKHKGAIVRQNLASSLTTQDQEGDDCAKGGD